MAATVITMFVGFTPFNLRMARSGRATEVRVTQAPPLTEGGARFTNIGHASPIMTELIGSARCDLSLGGTVGMTSKRLPAFSSDASRFTLRTDICDATPIETMLACLAGIDSLFR